MKYPNESSPDKWDEWFESERGTELEDDDIPDYELMTDPYED